MAVVFGPFLTVSYGGVRRGPIRGPDKNITRKTIRSGRAPPGSAENGSFLTYRSRDRNLIRVPGGGKGDVSVI